MEIEAKYTISDAEFAILQKVNALGDYKLEPIEEQHLTDHYMDTTNRDIWQGGYACRIREKNGEWLLTVKGRGNAEGAIHQREEYEIEVLPGMPPQQWPDSTARDLVFSLTHSRPMVELCVIRQRRTLRLVCQGQRRVGELSLDLVETEAGSQHKITYEVEIELKQDGTLKDLRMLGEILQGYGLQPEPRSKFERALALLK